MKKTYVIDTNVLLQAPHALISFEDNDIVLPIAVLEELDKFKDSDGEKGANARTVVRMLDKFRKVGNITEGVPTDNGGTIRLMLNCVNNKLPDTWDEEKKDNRILKVCKHFAEETDNETILVSNDTVLRIKADSIGIKAEEFTTDRSPELHNQYIGRITVWTDEESFNNFAKNKELDTSKTYLLNDKYEKFEPNYTINQFVLVTSDINTNQTLLGKFDGHKIVSLIYSHDSPFGIKPRNVGQIFVQEALMDNNVPLAIIKGPAGTAKTFYSLAVGLHKTYTHNPKNKEYRKILICRPNAEFDDDIGFLPGDEQEKISPLLRPIRDNLEILIDRDEEERYADEKELSDKVQELFDREIITAEALNFIRGRSIAKTWLIIDEAQNLTPKQAKGIITRAGKGTKIIMVGDPAQIDNPFLDERTNGLSFASEKMKGSKLCYQVTMQDTECERSELAMDAASRM